MARKQPPPVRLRSGVVSSTNGDGTVNVRMEGRTIRARKLSGSSYSAGQAALVTIRGQSATVLGSTGTAATDPNPAATIPLPGDRLAYQGTAFVLRPIFTGSFHGASGAWWTRGMWQGIHGGGGNTGVFFLGGNLDYLLQHSDAVLTLGLTRLDGGQASPVSPKLWLANANPYTGTASPWSTPGTLTPSQTWMPGEAHTVTLPAAWTAQLWQGAQIAVGGDDALPAAGWAGHKAYLTGDGPSAHS